MTYESKSFKEHHLTRLPVLERLLLLGWEREQIICPSPNSDDTEWHVPKTPSEATNRESKRSFKGYPVDIALFDDVEFVNDYEHIVAIIECKEPNKNEGISQLKIYLGLEPHARLGIWTNGTEFVRVYKLPSAGDFKVVEGVGLPKPTENFILAGDKRITYSDLQIPSTRELKSAFSIADTIAEITTDDERIVLYYILHENVRKVSKSTVSSWLNTCEIRGVNVDNAFDLLSSFDNGALNNDTLEFGIDTFRKYSANAAQILPPLKKCVDQHIELAVNIFKKIWSDDTLDINIRLFIAYIVEERIRAFGDRWMAEGEIENIRQWESKNTLDSTLSNNYGSCLEFFVQNELVYASSWTSYGNPREYTLFPSLQELLFNCPHKIMEELQKVKDAYHLDLPF